MNKSRQMFLLDSTLRQGYHQCNRHCAKDCELKEGGPNELEDDSNNYWAVGESVPFLMTDATDTDLDASMRLLGLERVGDKLKIKNDSIEITEYADIRYYHNADRYAASGEPIFAFARRRITQ